MEHHGDGAKKSLPEDAKALQTVPTKRYNAEFNRSHTTMNTEEILGRSPERLTLGEQQELSGKFIALEIYTPQTLPLRRIEAVAEGPAACLEQLQKRGLDPSKFEIQLYQAPFWV
jgi:hypothetical protein